MSINCGVWTTLAKMAGMVKMAGGGHLPLKLAEVVVVVVARIL